MSDGYADGELVWYHLYVNRVLKGVLAPPPSLPSFLRGMGGVLKQVAVVQYKMFFRVSGCIKFLLSFLLLFKVFYMGFTDVVESWWFGNGKTVLVTMLKN